MSILALIMTTLMCFDALSTGGFETASLKVILHWKSATNTTWLAFLRHMHFKLHTS